MPILLLLALVTAVIGIAPLLLVKRVVSALILGVPSFFVLLGIYYLLPPALVGPLWGVVGFFVFVLWVVCAIIGVGAYTAWGSIAFPITLGVVYLFIGFSGCGLFRDNDYKNLIGPMEQREWTSDVQPKDPQHVRLVPKELAYYLATKQLGEVPGAIGSQFEISRDSLTLQMVNGELWYVAPLDFTGFSAWTAAKTSPGYVMINGEDPKRQVLVKIGEKFRYMPGAFFNDDLHRHLWWKYYDKGLTDYSFEIDENGKAFWVVTVFEPTIAWSGPKVNGVVILDPVSGEDTFYPLGKVPDWVDRAVPGDFVKNYLNNYGNYIEGWWNSVWGNRNLMEPETPDIVYGSDGNPYWVTGMTSVNAKDKSLVGLVYTNSRTGKSVWYHAVGGTDSAVLQLVDNKVSYRKLHGASPVLYNIYGVMTSIVPLLGESHTFQGVAFVDVANMQVAVGDDQYTAFREYQRVLATSGQQIAPEKERDIKEVSGLVDRFASVFGASETVYYIHIKDVPHIFVGSVELSPKLPLTQVGDNVRLLFVDSGESTLMLRKFENLSLSVDESTAEQQLKERVGQRQGQVASEQESRSARGQIQNMTDEELKKLLDIKKEQEKQKKAPATP